MRMKVSDMIVCLRFLANTNVKSFIFEQNLGLLEHRHIDFST